MGTKKHVNNTYSRNLGLFKTFMLWAFKNGYTYNQEFKEMQKVPKVIIPQVALQKADLEQLMQKDFENVRLERVRDVFVFALKDPVVSVFQFKNHYQENLVPYPGIKQFFFFLGKQFF